MGFWWNMNVVKDVDVRGQFARVSSLFPQTVSQRTNSGSQIYCKCIYVLRQPAGPLSA